MSEEQRRKTVFCSFKDLKQYVDPNNLLINMGGMVCRNVATWIFNVLIEKNESKKT